MRVAVLYPSSNIRVPFNPAELWTSSRGMTGSEGSCVHYAISLAKLGHSVTLFVKSVGPGHTDGINVCPYEEWASTYAAQHWDAVCSWMTPEPLKLAQPGVFRLFNEQVSDFSCCEPGWESYVDLFCVLSQSHADYMAGQTGFDRTRWRIMHNGVDCNAFRPGEKVRGKCIWASSHDRGLHWLLEVWPKVRAGFPDATLHIFYDFNGVEVFSRMEGFDPSQESNRRYNELGQRSRYVLEALRRMEGKHGVHTYKSVSRDRIKDEMASSSVLSYPLDPIHYTETFGVTVLEACATGTVPVICAADCFDELWGKVSVKVQPPYPSHKDKYVDNLVRTLGSDHLSLVAKNCVDHARQFDWEVLGRRLEATLLSRGVDGFAKANVV